MQYKSHTSMNTVTSGETHGFLNDEQLRERIPICRRTLASWRRKGKIPFIKIGARVLYDWPSVQSAILRLQRGGGL